MEVHPVEMVSYPSEETPMESEEVGFNAAGYLKHWPDRECVYKNIVFLLTKFSVFRKAMS